MKKIIIAISFILTALLVYNCKNISGKDVPGSRLEVNDTGTANITFTEYEHHFGKVKEGEKIGYTFTFENQGTGSLVIASAITTCGCTVPKFDKKPVPPGKRGSLEVIFDTSGRSGMQTKTITVNSNASKPVVLLKITAEVTNE
jgi:hypothetical protein